MKSIEIFNFKNFRHLQIDNLGAVNLIVGRNNSGKSTLLEAISILASGGGIGWLKKILEIRGWNPDFPDPFNEDVRSLGRDIVCSLYHGRDFEEFKRVPIILRSSGSILDSEEQSSIEIQLVEFMEVYVTDENGMRFNKLVLTDKVSDSDRIVSSEPSIGLSISSNESKSILQLDSFFYRKSFSGEKYPSFEFVKTADFTSSKNSALFDKIALSPLEDILIDALRIIDPHITGINFLNDDSRSYAGAQRSSDLRVPFVVCDNMKGKHRLSAMGDGINRILTIVLSMLNCKDGILLLDEFENGLHYSVQTALWTLICHLAKDLNIQVFATTHSKDCINSFLSAVDSDADNARLIRLEKRKDKEVAVVYDDIDELDYISKNDIETR